MHAWPPMRISRAVNIIGTDQADGRCGIVAVNGGESSAKVAVDSLAGTNSGSVSSRLPKLRR